MLVLMGCGSAIIARLIHWIQETGFYFRSYGVSYGLRNSSISGCNINPAISISMLVVGKLSVKEKVLYVVFYYIGAIIGAGILLGEGFRKLNV